MSSFLCFICHNTVNSDTNAETREKYKDMIGMKLCPDSHLCHICCHLLRKLWLFKSICLRRSMEYPILFSDKGTVTLQNSNIENIILCPEAEECEQQQNSTYHFTSGNDNIDTNQYVSLEDKTDLQTDNIALDHDKNDGDDNDVDDNDGDDNDGDDNDDDNNDDHDNDDIDNDNPETEDIERQETKNTETDDVNDESQAKEESIKYTEFYKVTLSVEEQRAELEQKRREDKYLEAEFKCYNCAMGFLFKDTYQAHMMRHEESNGEHLCSICLLRFATAAVLRAHLLLHRERHVCARCGRAVRPRRRHAHTARCAPQGSEAICHLCSKSFSDANALQQHIKRFHLSKTSNKSYSCHVCGKTYNNQGAVRTHMIKHINKRFTCDQCPSTFSSPYTLAQHRKNHSTVQLHHCETCRISYNSRKSLLAHLRNALCHQLTVYVCPICSRSCANRRSLAAHTQTVHSARKPHACAECGARFGSRRGLRGHERRHRGQRPAGAVCHLCGASFKGNNKLNRHLRSVCEKNQLEEELSVFYNQEELQH